MGWTDKNDAELQDCYNKLRENEGKLQSQLGPIMLILNNITQIQTKKLIASKDNQVTKIIPKDLWGKDMTDEYRLKIKDECVKRTNELLGN